MESKSRSFSTPYNPITTWLNIKLPEAKGPTLFSKRRAWVFSRPLRKMLQIHFATHNCLLVTFDLGMCTLNSFLPSSPKPEIGTEK